MKSLIILLIFLPSSLFAGGHCFVRPKFRVKQIAIIKPTKVINRLVRLEPVKQPEIDPAGIIAEARALKMAYEAVDTGDLQRPAWRTSRFANNMGLYQPSPQIRQQAIQSQAVTRKVVGIVNTSFRILPNGKIDFNVTKEQQERAKQPQQTGYGY